MPGQPQLGTNPILGIDCTNLVVTDPNDPLGPSNLIIPANNVFDVSVQFTLGGLLAGWLVATAVPFTVTYFFEGMGGAPEGTLGTVPGMTVGGQTAYGPAETTLSASIPTAGIYRLTAVVGFGGPPVTAFTEGPMVQIS